MPRLRQVPRAEAHATAKALYERLFGDRDPVVSPGTATGTPGNWWTVFALVPGLFRPRGRRLRLLPQPPSASSTRACASSGQTRAGFARGSQFVFSQHCKAAATSA